jgi:hypothetical protein
MTDMSQLIEAARALGMRVVDSFGREIVEGHTPEEVNIDGTLFRQRAGDEVISTTTATPTTLLKKYTEMGLRKFAKKNRMTFTVNKSGNVTMSRMR